MTKVQASQGALALAFFGASLTGRGQADAKTGHENAEGMACVGALCTFGAQVPLTLGVRHRRKAIAALLHARS